MDFLRQLDAALARLAGRPQGQDVERHNAVRDNRLGGDYAAVMTSRHGQGVSSIGLGR